MVIGTRDAGSSTVIQLNNVQNIELEHLGSKKDAVFMSSIQKKKQQKRKKTQSPQI